METNNKQYTIVFLFPLLELQRYEDAPQSGLSFFGKMSLFRCGFTVQKKKVTERPNNSDASEEIQPAVPHTFQAKKALPWIMSNIMQWNRPLRAC